MKHGAQSRIDTPPLPSPRARRRGGASWRHKEEFKVRVLVWAAKLDVKASAIYIRPMRRKWASCSTAGTLSFNDELIGLDREIGDYVIVHELLHFSVPNHGKLWKSLMRAHLGDYERMEEKLTRLAKGQNPHASQAGSKITQPTSSVSPTLVESFKNELPAAREPT